MSELFSKDLVAELVARLEPLPFQVEELPKHPGPKGFTHKYAAVWVGYNASQYSKPESVEVPVQTRTMFFDVQVLVRSAASPKLLTEIVEEVRRLLHGVKFSHGGRCYMARDGFAAYKDAVWRHELVVAIPMTSIPLGDPAVAPTTLTKFTLVDEGDNVQFQLPEEP